MKWTRNELEHNDAPVVFDEDIAIDDAVFASSVLIQGVTDVHVDGTGCLTDDDNILVALDTGRVIAGDSFDLETGAFEISPAERVRFWSYGTWMDELNKTKEKK